LIYVLECSNYFTFYGGGWDPPYGNLKEKCIGKRIKLVEAGFFRISVVSQQLESLCANEMKTWWWFGLVENRDQMGIAVHEEDGILSEQMIGEDFVAAGTW